MAGMIITMARGDIFPFSFGVYSDNELISEEMDDIYFTVKNSHYSHDFLFQKRLSDGSIASDGEGGYSIFIDPEDTDNLDFGEYEFDIEIIKRSSAIKRTFTGILCLTEEVTHANNEVTPS